MFSGLLDNGQLYHKFDEVLHEGMRLGRNLWLDARSLAHMIENDVHAMAGPLADKQWERVLAILDQGQVGSCTGNAGTGTLGTQPFYDTVGHVLLPDPKDEQAGEKFAVQLYTDATIIDAYPGEYPAGRHRLVGSRDLQGAEAARHDQGLSMGAQPRTDCCGSCNRRPSCKACRGTKRSSSPTATASSTPTRTGSRVGSPAATRSRRSASSSTRRTPSTASSRTRTAGGRTGVTDGYFRMRLRTYEDLHSIDLKQYTV